jgi:hypothetical protein
MRAWYLSETGVGNKKQLSTKEILEVMDKQFGTCKNNMWVGVKMQKYADLANDDPNTA